MHCTYFECAIESAVHTFHAKCSVQCKRNLNLILRSIHKTWIKRPVYLYAYKNVFINLTKKQKKMPKNDVENRPQNILHEPTHTHETKTDTNCTCVVWQRATEYRLHCRSFDIGQFFWIGNVELLLNNEMVTWTIYDGHAK